MRVKDLTLRLSKNFALGEFRVSKEYPVLAKKITFDVTDYLSLKLLCLEALQPLRDHFGPITIESGKRSEELNEKVGGSPSSDHLTCNAADIVPLNFNVEQVFLKLVSWAEIPYRQAILYPKEKFIHISVNHPMKEDQHSAFVCINNEYKPYKEYRSL